MHLVCDFGIDIHKHCSTSPYSVGTHVLIVHWCAYSDELPAPRESLGPTRWISCSHAVLWVSQFISNGPQLRLPLTAIASNYNRIYLSLSLSLPPFLSLSRSTCKCCSALQPTDASNDMDYRDLLRYQTVKIKNKYDRKYNQSATNCLTLL